MTDLEFLLECLLKDMEDFCVLGYQKNINPLPSLRESLGLQVQFKHNINYVPEINESIEKTTEPFFLVELNDIESDGEVKVAVHLIPSNETYKLSRTTLYALKKHNFNDLAIYDLWEEYCLQE